MLNHFFLAHHFSRALVMEINRLKVRQEKLELEELQNESQLSYL